MNTPRNDSSLKNFLRIFAPFICIILLFIWFTTWLKPDRTVVSTSVRNIQTKEPENPTVEKKRKKRTTRDLLSYAPRIRRSVQGTVVSVTSDSVEIATSTQHIITPLPLFMVEPNDIVVVHHETINNYNILEPYSEETIYDVDTFSAYVKDTTGSMLCVSVGSPSYVGLMIKRPSFPVRINDPVLIGSQTVELYEIVEKK